VAAPQAPDVIVVRNDERDKPLRLGSIRRRRSTALDAPPRKAPRRLSSVI